MKYEWIEHRFKGPFPCNFKIYACNYAYKHKCFLDIESYMWRKLQHLETPNVLTKLHLYLGIKMAWFDLEETVS